MADNQLRYSASLNTTKFLSGANAMKGAVLLLGAAVAKSVQINSKFEKQLSTLRGVSGATAKQMEALTEQSRDLGKSTAFTAIEVAGAQTELAKLGFTTNQILNSTGGVLDLAAGLEVSLAEAATLTGSVLNQFGLDASETRRVVNILSKSTTTSALDFSKLTEAMKVAGPAAKSINIGLEETVATLATLADLGLGGSIGGTAFKKFVSASVKSGKTISQLFDEIANSADPAATSVKLLGDRTFGAGVAIAKSRGKVEELRQSFLNLDNDAENLRLTKEDNLIGDFAKLESAASDLAITLGSVLDPALRKSTQEATAWLTLFSDVIKTVDERRKKGGLSEIFGFTKTQARFSSEDELKPGFRYDAATDTFRDEADNVVKKYEALVSKFKDGVTAEFDINGEVIIKDAEGNTISYEDALKIPDIGKKDGSVGGGTGDGTPDPKAQAQAYKDITSEISHQSKVMEKQGVNQKDIWQYQLKQLKALKENAIGAENYERVLRSIELLTLDIGNFRVEAELILGIDPKDTTYNEIKKWGEGALNELEVFSNAWGIKLDDLNTITVMKGDELANSIRATAKKQGIALKDGSDDIEEKGNELGPALQSSLTAAFTGIAHAIGEALSGDDVDFGDKFLKLLGEFMQQFGAALIAVGVAEIALESGNPWLMVAGGAALIIAGSLISAAAANKPNMGLRTAGPGPAPQNNVEQPDSVQGAGFGRTGIVGKIRGQDQLFQLQGAMDNRTALT